MKTLTLTLMLASLLVSATTLADENSANGHPQIGHMKNTRGKPINLEGTHKDAATIDGLCLMVQSAANPIASPCVNALISVSAAPANTSNYAEVSKVRTDTKGHFEYTAEQGMIYQFTASSSSFSVVGTKALVHGGDHVTLKLKQN